jgi:hypothetical protein
MVEVCCDNYADGEADVGKGNVRSVNFISDQIHGADECPIAADAYPAHLAASELDLG